MKKLNIVVFLGVILYCTMAYSQNNWVRTNPGGGGAIAVVGATANSMIVAASDLSGIYLSEDNGNSWRVSGWNNNLHETHISALGFHPSDGKTFIVGTYNGAYKTIDGGLTFDLVLAQDPANGIYPYIEDIVYSHSNPSIAYITFHSDASQTDGQVYKSLDGGDSWSPVLGADLPNGLRIVKLMVHPLNENIVYALSGKSRFSCSAPRLYRSIDGGQQWNQIATTIGDVLDFDLHPTDEQIIFVSTFVANACPLNPADFESFSFEDFVGGDWTSGEFYKSIDGGNVFNSIGTQTGIINVDYSDANHIKLVNILSITQYFNDYGNVSENQVGTFSTTNGGVSWQHTGSILDWDRGYRTQPWLAFSWSYNGLTKTVTKDEFDSNKMYASFGQWAWSSTDGGDTINNISTQEVSSGYWLSTGLENINGHALEINAANPTIIYMGGYDIGFWHSKNSGASWKQILPDLQLYEDYIWDSYDGSSLVPGRNEGTGANVSTMISDPNREAVIWSSFSDQQYDTPTGLFKSTNYGEGWQLKTTGLPSFSQSVRMYGLSLDVNSPVNNRTLYLTVAGNVYKSTNDGEAWAMVFANGGLKFTQVDKFNPQLIYAGGENGLFRSTDAGGTWFQIGAQFQTEMQGNLANMRPDIVPTYSEDGASGIKAWQGVFEIQTDAFNANWAYVTGYGTAKGLYRSKDAGVTWEKLLTDDYMRGVAITPNDSSVIYATASASYHSGANVDSSGIRVSHDEGVTWQSINNGMAWNYGGTIRTTTNNKVWAWSPGTGVQYLQADDYIFVNGFE